MYKVVIIDDEPVIVQGLTKMMPWQAWGCQVIGTAQDGEEGMILIRREKPDIIISDIAMPGMNGLQMVAGLKSEFENMEIAILTGYRNFDYAQEAIRLGVTRYLLKPSKNEELSEAIEAMTANLRKKNITGEEEKDRTCANFVVKNALDYMESHYAEKITLSELADKVYVSQWHLSRLLNRRTGQTFSELINSIRIEKAKEFMRDPSLRIGDVAEQVGFQDMTHFSRVFRKLTGMSANEYRNMIK